jgi:hypothetical protein
VEFRREEWQQPYTTASYLAVLCTSSDHRALEPTAQAKLLGCIASLTDTGYGGQISRRYLTELRIAHSRPGDKPAGGTRNRARTPGTLHLAAIPPHSGPA